MRVRARKTTTKIDNIYIIYTKERIYKKEKSRDFGNLKLKSEICYLLKKGVTFWILDILLDGLKGGVGGNAGRACRIIFCAHLHNIVQMCITASPLMVEKRGGGFKKCTIWCKS